MDVVTLTMAKAYTDKKAGYTEMTEVVILPEQTMPADKYYVSFPKNTANANLTIGETYIVVFDGVEYEREALFHELGECPYLGNSYLMEDIGTNNGDPFIVADFGNGQFDAAVEKKGNTHTVAVYQRTETIHPIDPKFLPGVCLPVVEITSAEYPAEGMVELSDMESSQFDAVAETSAFVLVKLPSEMGFPYSVVATRSITDGIYIYLCKFGDAVYLFAKTETGWIMGA